MIAAAGFSHRPWTAGEEFDRLEDVLHSVAATGMGFAFAIGVVITALGRSRSDTWRQVLDIGAILASVAIPLSMSAWPDIGGVLQRLMFAVAYGWYAAEAARELHHRRPATAEPQAAGRPWSRRR